MKIIYFVLFTLLLTASSSQIYSQYGTSFYINSEKANINTSDSGINCTGGEIHDDGSIEG